MYTSPQLITSSQAVWILQLYTPHLIRKLQALSLLRITKKIVSGLWVSLAIRVTFILFNESLLYKQKSQALDKASFFWVEISLRCLFSDLKSLRMSITNLAPSIYWALVRLSVLIWAWAERLRHPQISNTARVRYAFTIKNGPGLQNN